MPEGHSKPPYRTSPRHLSPLPPLPGLHAWTVNSRVATTARGPSLRSRRSSDVHEASPIDGADLRPWINEQRTTRRSRSTDEGGGADLKGAKVKGIKGGRADLKRVKVKGMAYKPMKRRPRAEARRSCFLDCRQSTI